MSLIAVPNPPFPASLDAEGEAKKKAITNFMVAVKPLDAIPPVTSRDLAACGLQVVPHVICTKSKKGSVKRGRDKDLVVAPGIPGGGRNVRKVSRRDSAVTVQLGAVPPEEQVELRTYTNL
jgi:hypothetical protein